jgi:hypothetical protein
MLAIPIPLVFGIVRIVVPPAAMPLSHWFELPSL